MWVAKEELIVLVIISASSAKPQDWVPSWAGVVESRPAKPRPFNPLMVLSNVFQFETSSPHIISVPVGKTTS